MSAKIKTADEIEKMREAGRLAAEVLEMIEPYVKAGVTTLELDEICHKHITETQQAIPAPLNYHGFPKSICTSINHVVCHGIPASEDVHIDSSRKKPAVLQNGDIINIDITVIKDGYHGDTSKMFEIGEVSVEDRRLCRIAQESLYLAMKKVKPGVRLGELGSSIEKFIKTQNKSNPRMKLSIVKDFCGHGIGAEFHEEPQVVHYKNGDRTILQPGMCFTIEPMINAGKFGCDVDDEDGWTVYTVDNKKSAQWEHTLLVTDKGCEVLTLRSDESLPRHLINA